MSCPGDDYYIRQKHAFRVTSPTHLSVFLCISFLHISEAIAQPLDSCLKNCFHLFNLVTRYVFFAQHEFLLRSFSLQAPDLDGVIDCTDTRSAQVSPCVQAVGT